MGLELLRKGDTGIPQRRSFWMGGRAQYSSTSLGQNALKGSGSLESCNHEAACSSRNYCRQGSPKKLRLCFLGVVFK